MDMQREKCKATKYDNAIILPQREVQSGPMWGLGGVCDENGSFIKDSFYDGGWASHGGKYEWKEEEWVDDNAVYFGVFFKHWGHFLIDLTTRCWFLPIMARSNQDFVVAYLGDVEPDGNYLRFFELLGVRKEQLKRITVPTRFAHVYVPEQGFKSCEWYTEEHVHMVNCIVDAVLKCEESFPSLRELKKVYFTRRAFSKARHSEFGEEYFESLFAKNGFTSVSPELLSLEEQIYLWNHAEEIVCVNGTIPLNALFCKNRDLKLTVLNKTSILHENPYILLRMRGISAEFLDVYKEPLKGYPKSLGEGPFLFWPSEQFDRYCREHGMAELYGKTRRTLFFLRQKLKYHWAVLGLTDKARSFLSRSLSQQTKQAIKRRIHRIID